MVALGDALRALDVSARGDADPLDPAYRLADLVGPEVTERDIDRRATALTGPVVPMVTRRELDHAVAAERERVCHAAERAAELVDGPVAAGLRAFADRLRQG